MKPETTSALLPKTNSSENEVTGVSSISGAVFNVSTSMIGAEIMSIPATLKVLGIIPGFVVIIIMAVLVEVTVEFLLRYTNYSGEANTYGGVMGESFGKLGSVGLQICVMISNLGALIMVVWVSLEIRWPELRRHWRRGVSGSSFLSLAFHKCVYCDL